MDSPTTGLLCVCRLRQGRLECGVSSAWHSSTTYHRDMTRGAERDIAINQFEMRVFAIFLASLPLFWNHSF